MSTDLREGLDRLASGMAAPVRPLDLWDRGVRRRRRRRASTLGAAAVVVLLLALVGGAAWWSLTPLPAEPAATRGAAAIPDQIEAPSPWSRGTDAAGPLGQLAVLLDAPRHTGLFTTAQAPYGISATTGTYRWLDLPDLATDPAGAPVLSPDGRHVGYWLRGRSARRSTGVVGFAVYDTTTGRVVRHLVPAPAGLSELQMGWFGDAALVVGCNPVTRVDSDSVIHEGGPRRTYLWSSGTDGLTSLRHGISTSTSQAWASAGRPVSWTGGGRRFWVWDRASRTSTGYRVTAGYLQSVVVSPDGRRAALDLGQTSPVVVHLPSGGGVLTPPRPALHVVGVPLGWRDPDHLALFDPGSDRVSVTNLRTRVSRGVITSTQFLGQGDVASDLWRRSVASRPGPAWVPGPWIGSAFLFLGGIVALCVVVAVRSRPRDRA